jgi:hypothetical protein
MKDCSGEGADKLALAMAAVKKYCFRLVGVNVNLIS